MRDLRRRIDGSDRVMILAPHPDDESLATAGVLQWTVRCGGQARVVFLTDGENNPWAQRATERRWGISTNDRRRWGARRRREAIAALACLGLSPACARFLGLPDQHLTEGLLDDANELVNRLATEIREWNPTQLFAPAQQDHHPDHGVTAVMVRLALQRLPRQPNLFHFRIHPPARRNSPLASWLVLTCEERALKRQAVLCHASQLALGRRGLLEFIDMPERFEASGTCVPTREEHLPLRALGSNARAISFSIRMSPRVLLGGAALLLLIPFGNSLSALRVNLGERGTQGLRIDAGHEAIVSTRRDGADVQVTIAAPILEFVSGGLAKLDLLRERQMGLFDRWPWQGFTKAHTVLPVPMDIPRAIEPAVSIANSHEKDGPELRQLPQRVAN